jgi:hypothetical protein
MDNKEEREKSETKVVTSVINRVETMEIQADKIVTRNICVT